MLRPYHPKRLPPNRVTTGVKPATVAGDDPVNDLARKSVVTLLVVGPLVAAVYAVILTWRSAVNWYDLALLGVMYALVGFGVTIGFHRFLTHDSFKARRPVKILLVILGTMSLEGTPIAWAANHRLHHAHADRDGDLHSPHLSKNLIAGFLHAHVGWLFGNREADPKQWARDLLNDPDIVFVNRYSVLWILLSFLIPFAIGGWSGLLWGGFVRVLLTHHATWSVNSVCHMFGSRPFAPKDESRNHWLVGLLAFGEGGHNTHHASPRSARHGLHWWHFDLSWVVIRTLESVRLAYNVYTLDRDDLTRALRTKAAGIKASLRRPRRQPNPG
jgi:stearoyl-CoA desaturase (delta-9 desaturase)